MIRRLLSLLAAVALTSACGPRADNPAAPLGNAPEKLKTAPPAQPCVRPSILPERELLIRSLSVVEDPIRTKYSATSTHPAQGAWTFGALMSSMAEDVPPQQFVREWLRQWELPQTVNGEVVPAHAEQMRKRVVDPWLAASGGGALDLSKAPFRLLAIVNRIDLRDLTQGSAGEARFVFGFVPFDNGPYDFTVNLEYRIPATTEADVKAWAERWHALAQLTPGTESYNAALQELTDTFTKKGAAPMRPNSSALSQLRTNEAILNEVSWELREFTLSPTTGLLQQSPLAQTPPRSLNGTTQLRDLVNANEAAILAKTFVLPLNQQGGHVQNLRNVWNAAGIRSPEARHLLSLNTCDGCHGDETGISFHHITNRGFSSEAQLSQFMTGKTVRDPITGEQRSFNELQRRSEDLGQLLCPEPVP